jgi:hypothetical protein
MFLTGNNCQIVTELDLQEISSSVVVNLRRLIIISSIYSELLNGVVLTEVVIISANECR